MGAALQQGFLRRELERRGAARLDSFRDLARSSTELQAELRDTVARQLFEVEVLRFAHACGYFFTAREVQTAVQDERRRWNQISFPR